MARTAIATDSNSGITQSQAKELGVFVLPMPFFMRGKIQFEDIDLTQEQFYEILAEDAAVSTSQPSPGDLMDFWNKILEEYDDIVYIPMSSGLSTSCDTATVLSEDYEGKVQVVNNQRISVTQQQSVLDAKKMANRGVDTVADARVYAWLDFYRAGILPRKVGSQFPLEMYPVNGPGIRIIRTVGMRDSGWQDKILVGCDRIFLVAATEPSGSLYTINEDELADRLFPFTEMMQGLRVITDVRNVQDR